MYSWARPYIRIRVPCSSRVPTLTSFGVFFFQISYFLEQYILVFGAVFCQISYTDILKACLCGLDWKYGAGMYERALPLFRFYAAKRVLL